jgi:hypothetical protein
MCGQRRGVLPPSREWLPAPSTASQSLDMVALMTGHSDVRALRLAWGIGLCSLGLLVASLILLAFPAAIGLAIMRHGLYDIDVFISRALVYGSLAVFITAVYVGIAVGIGTVVGSGASPRGRAGRQGARDLSPRWWHLHSRRVDAAAAHRAGSLTLTTRLSGSRHNDERRACEVTPSMSSAA